jgi:hypothetical protein
LKKKKPPPNQQVRIDRSFEAGTIFLFQFLIKTHGNLTTFSVGHEPVGFICFFQGKTVGYQILRMDIPPDKAL